MQKGLISFRSFFAFFLSEIKGLLSFEWKGNLI